LGLLGLNLSHDLVLHFMDTVGYFGLHSVGYILAALGNIGILGRNGIKVLVDRGEVVGDIGLRCRTGFGCGGAGGG
jgi:hypothetical protein